MAENQGKKNMSSGRSMIEMLGVLAIIGVLSIAAIIGLPLMFQKRRASQIVYDAHLAWLEAQEMAQATDYHPVNILGDSQAAFEFRRDSKGDGYVRTAGIEKAVCRQILNHEVAGKLAFYAQDEYSKPTCSEEENTIIFAFEGVSGPSLDCENVDHCPEGNSWICNEYGICDECSDGLVPNLDHTDCILLSCGDDETMCSVFNEGTGKYDKWCCPNTQICGSSKDVCDASDGYCSYEFAEPVETTLHCAYTFAEPVERTLHCAYTFNINGDVVTLTLKDNKGCGEGEWCNLRFASDDCEDTANSNTPNGAVIYGSCSPMNSAYSTCEKELDTTNVVTQVSGKGCGEGEWCNLRFASDDCEGTANSNTPSGTVIYGSCSPMNSAYSTCEMALDTTDVVTAKKPCLASEYCYLRYSAASEDGCESADSNITDTIYGICLELNKGSSNAVCPVQ